MWMSNSVSASAGVDAARVAARSHCVAAGSAAGAPRLDRDEADRRPHEQPARLHRGVGAEAVVAHRVDERPRHLHERVAPEREDQPALLRRQRAAIAARCAQRAA